MAHRLACELSDTIAAAASVMITLPKGFPDTLQPSEPVPFLLIQGDEDPFFPWEGGTVQQGPYRQSEYMSAADTVAFWVSANGANTLPVVDSLPDQDPCDGTRVYRETYSGGVSGADILFYRVQGGGHTWPGSNKGLLEKLTSTGRVSNDFSASYAIWDFCASHQKPHQNSIY